MSDKEMAISEHSVKAASILQDESHILGKYEIHVLPEGSALLNPSDVPLCLDSSRSAMASLPLQINQTNPSSIELIRYDLKTSQNETIKLGPSQIRKMMKGGVRHPSGAILLEYSLSKPGLYKLGRVVDSTNIEVGHPISEALVVQCPKARIKSAGPSRCRGDLSNIVIEVEGSAPLKIKYRKTVNGEDRDITYQSIQPDTFVSHVLYRPGSGASDTSLQGDLLSAAPAVVEVPLNETLTQSGLWSYSIDEVSDVYGNVVPYDNHQSEYEQSRPKGGNLEDTFRVHERPLATLNGHYTKNPIHVALGRPVKFPLQLQSSIRSDPDKLIHLTYRFTPSNEISSNGEHSAEAQTRSLRASIEGGQTSVTEPGFYTLDSVRTDHCAGEVVEPSSFIVINPAEPGLDFVTEKMVDKCADRQVGLRVDFNLTGTPPYTVHYTSQIRGGQVNSEHARFEGPRGQLEFSPEFAGHWTYKILSLDDAMYSGIDLRRRNLVLEQDVRPPAFAYFTSKSPTRISCIDEPVNIDVALHGEKPWTLEYELVYGKQRTKLESKDIDTNFFTITTERLRKGGEYSLALIGVSDGQGCRESLSDDVKISVKQQKPRASFGQIEGKRSVQTLEGRPVQLPLRLAGESPWTVHFRHVVNDTTGRPLPGPVASESFLNANDGLQVQDPGAYELVSINDARCPGAVDDSANLFDVHWVDRPQIRIPRGSYVEQNGDTVIRSDVCEGEEDAMDVGFIGRPPYDVKYQESLKPESGSKSVRPAVEMSVPVNSAQIKMDTAKAGIYEYTFTELGDYNYNHDSRRHSPVVIQQRVHRRPSVSFVNPGKVHSFCQDSLQDSSQASEAIPISLQGAPPFTIDIEIRHQGSSIALKPKSITIPNIASTTHSLQIPHAALQSGASNVVIRRVRDSRGCERFYDAPSSIASSQKASQAAGNAAPRVQVAVHAAPSLTAAEPHRRDYCVGERLGFSLSGMAPFIVYYTFAGSAKKASVPGATFRRIAESPGNFTITGVSDGSSECKANVKGISRTIHALPRVKVSKGRTERYDIHAGGSVDVTFEFQGEPPFDFTYTRSEAVKQKGSTGGYRQGPVLDTRTLRSYERTKMISESEEGVYEVVAIRDKFCSFARQGYEGIVSGTGAEGAGRALDGPDLDDEHLLEL